MTSHVTRDSSISWVNYVKRVFNASNNSSDENQADLLNLAMRIPSCEGATPKNLADLISKLIAFRSNPTYDPTIASLAKQILGEYEPKL